MLREILISLFIASAISNFTSDREEFLKKEQMFILGSNITLTYDEEQVNQVLMGVKMDEILHGMENPIEFAPAKHFFDAKAFIDRSVIFQIIKSIPKGGSLFCYDIGAASREYIYQLTFQENLYGYIKGGNLRLRVFGKPPSCQWKLVSELRQNTTFDEFLNSSITVITSDPEKLYPDSNTAYRYLASRVETLEGLVLYRPLWKDYFYNVLKEFYEDNIMYLEIRSVCGHLYDIDGKVYDEIESVRFYREVTQQFMADHPDFQGVRLIYSPQRPMDQSEADRIADIAISLRRAYPDFVVGFDLLGQEDKARPLCDFIQQFKRIQDSGLTLFLQAGETNWFGTTADLNVIDAIMLGTKRIGHAFSAVKHPEVLKLMKERDIAIEICPISNQVLKLVRDLRNHPGVFYIANGFPVVVCADDPSMWGAQGLSYDWYLTFMSMTSINTDLRFLKQLAINSYRYSVLNDEETEKAIAEWETRWHGFVSVVSSRYGYMQK